MKTYAYSIDLKKDPELIAEYIEYHRNVWPEVLESLKKAGIINDRIFFLGTRLFMLIEADDEFDPKIDLQNHAAGLREKEWEDRMSKFQLPVEETGEGEWWAQMELVFDMSEQMKE
jgi:L-rhamnose mutarotase